MSRHLFVVLVAIGLVGGTSPAPNAQAVNPRSVPAHRGLTLLNDKASAARSNEPAAVRALVDLVFDDYAGVPVPKQSVLRKRTYEAELAFREGQHPAITEGQLVRAVNLVVNTYFAPPWARTNVEQIHIMRLATRPHAPQFVGTRPSGKGTFGISEKMNPAEAVFMCLFLMGGKMWDQDYRIPPEEWVKLVQLEKAWQSENGRPMASAGMNVRKPQTPVPAEVVIFTELLAEGVGREDSVVTAQASSFLTMLGIRK